MYAKSTLSHSDAVSALELFEQGYTAKSVALTLDLAPNPVQMLYQRRQLRGAGALMTRDRRQYDFETKLEILRRHVNGESGRVELKDIQLPDSMKRAMAREAEAEREKRAKIIAEEGESLAAADLGDASDTRMAHPLALQLRNLQTLVELGVEKNTTIAFPAPLKSAIGELGNFLAQETRASTDLGHATQKPAIPSPLRTPAPPDTNGTPVPIPAH